MKKLKDIRQENYVSHAQRKAVWAARNDEKEKANEAKDGDGANIVRDREFKEPKFKFKSHPYGSPEWHANKAEYEKFKAKQAAKKAMKKEAVEEKTLTPAEKKKREEIAKAMERENPGMDMRKKMAIATWQAKKVAEAAAKKVAEAILVDAAAAKKLAEAAVAKKVRRVALCRCCCNI